MKKAATVCLAAVLIGMVPSVQCRRAGFPAMPKNIERIGGGRGHAVVGPVHHKLHAFSNGAEFSDDEPVADERIVMGHMGFKVLAAGCCIIIVGVGPT